MDIKSVLLQGDCLEMLKELPDESVDSLVTDPPAGISFMSKAWDDDKGGRKQWIAWMSQVMQECLRVMKPGAHGLVWAIPRTSHWTATALEDAGFEIRDVVTHVFGSGFPKSMDISKAIDKQAGAEREVVGKDMSKWRDASNYQGNKYSEMRQADYETKCTITSPSTPEAKEWQGWGTALKPASEHWILIRKPISEKTVAANVLKHGTGGINIDASRITTADNLNGGAYSKSGRSSKMNGDDREGKSLGLYESGKTAGTYSQPQGRFPANLVLSHNPDCVEVGMKKVKSGIAIRENQAVSHFGNAGSSQSNLTYASPDGTETVTAFECTPGCPIKLLDEQSGTCRSSMTPSKTKRKWTKDDGTVLGFGQASTSYADSGGASRFFYCAKPSKREKNAGCEGLPTVMSKTMMRGTSGSGTKNFQGGFQDHLTLNNHPTVKSTKLMSYLITMITPPGGIVLDPFMGSGSTGVAAVKEGFDFIGIEKENEYYNIAEMRIGKAEGSNGKADNNQDPTAA